MYERELEAAIGAARQAGSFLEHCDRVSVDSADGRDIKLSADRESEKILIRCLGNTGLPVLSEECGFWDGGTARREKERKLRGTFWIIDPLDGTANYWKGMKELSCVSVALWKDGEPVVGVIYRFHCNELFTGVVGQGAWLNGKPLFCSDVNNVGAAVLATGFPLKGDFGAQSLAGRIIQFQRFKKIRMLGAAAVMGAFVAAGRVDAYMEEGIMLWDVAAACAIVRAAGGQTQLTISEDYSCVCRLYAKDELKKDWEGGETKC